ncbi:MAG: outer membrane beta-barrel protein [Bacteroidota bacterium]
MRNSLLCTVACCFIYLSTLNSQINVGVSGGITFADLNENALNSGVRSHQMDGFRVNAIANYRINPLFSVQSELGFMRKSGEVRGTENMVNHAQDIGFLTLVPCINLNIGRFTSYVGLGPSIYYMIDTDGFSEVTNERPFWLPSDNLFQTEFNRVNVGINYTGGIMYSATKYSIFFQFTYADIEDSFASIDIVDNDVNAESIRFLTYEVERILSFNLGLTFPLKRKK